MSDVLSAVVLGVAGFFLPGIFKSVVTRTKGMTIYAREARNSFIFDSTLDPLSMWRWFKMPQEMMIGDNSNDEEEKDDDDNQDSSICDLEKNESQRTHEPPGQDSSASSMTTTSRKIYLGLLLPAFLALVTQGALAALQFASNQETKVKTGESGYGVVFHPVADQPEISTRTSRCDQTPTGKDSLSTITMCYDTFYTNMASSRIRALSNDRYLLRITRTFAKRNGVDMFILGVAIWSEVFIRQVQVSPRILTRTNEAIVSVDESSNGIRENNRAIATLAQRILFSNSAGEQCSQDEEIRAWALTNHQLTWDVLFDCNGPPFALGNNPDTSSYFNTFASAIASAFQVTTDDDDQNSTSKYYLDTDDSAIAVDNLQAVSIEYSTSMERVVPDYGIWLILAGVVALKLLVDVIFGEDVNFKTALLVHEAAMAQEGGSGKGPPNLLSARGKLFYKNGSYLQITATPNRDEMIQDMEILEARLRAAKEMDDEDRANFYKGKIKKLDAEIYGRDDGSSTGGNDNDSVDDDNKSADDNVNDEISDDSSVDDNKHNESTETTGISTSSVNYMHYIMSDF